MTCGIMRGGTIGHTEKEDEQNVVEETVSSAMVAGVAGVFRAKVLMAWRIPDNLGR
jgi:hypothetical protein